MGRHFLSARASRRYGGCTKLAAAASQLECDDVMLLMFRAWFCEICRLHVAIHTVLSTDSIYLCLVATYRSLKIEFFQKIASFANLWFLINNYCCFCPPKWPKNAILALFWPYFGTESKIF